MDGSCRSSTGSNLFCVMVNIAGTLLVGYTFWQEFDVQVRRSAGSIAQKVLIKGYFRSIL